MFRFYAKKVVLELNQREVITSGSVNVYQCQFEFNSAWDDLEKTAVFKAGDSTVSVLLDETGMCIIPWEVLQDAKRTLYAGVYGTKNGNVVLPTIWASCGEIKEGVNPGESTQPPTPSVYDQILGQIGNLEDLQTTNKDSLVDAINEVYETGGGEGLPEITEGDEGKFLGVLDGMPQWVLGGSGSGNVSSPDVSTIRVLDRQEYDELPEKDSTTLYFIRG